MRNDKTRAILATSLSSAIKRPLLLDLRRKFRTLPAGISLAEVQSGDQHPRQEANQLTTPTTHAAPGRDGDSIYACDTPDVTCICTQLAHTFAGINVTNFPLVDRAAGVYEKKSGTMVLLQLRDKICSSPTERAARRDAPRGFNVNAITATPPHLHAAWTRNSPPLIPRAFIRPVVSLYCLRPVYVSKLAIRERP